MTADTSSFRLSFSGCRVTVMGLGRFGGGVGAVQFLQRQGAAVTVTDLLSAEELQEPLSQIDVDRLAALHLGGHVEQDFLDADLVVVNPAIPRGHPMLKLARRAGVPLSSELNLLWQMRPAPVIGVTGSNGKSTTAAMIHAILQAAGRNAFLGGNIGGSLLPRLEEISADDLLVLELSSFQLQDLDRLPSSPEVAVVTNFTPNHLDWHGSLDAYRRAKQAILRWQTPENISVLNADDPEVSTWCHHGRCYFFGRNDDGSPGVFRNDDRLRCRDLTGASFEIPLSVCRHLPGEHNVTNAKAAASVAVALDIPPEAIEAGLRAFRGLPHRLEFVGEWEGRRFYNDSLATTPESVAAALDSFEQPVVLLAGGYDKGIDLTGLAAAVAGKTKAAALIGQTAEPLDVLIERERFSEHPVTQVHDDFESAFRWAVAQSVPGDVVLLSPGCASYDWFGNFAERGKRFVKLVEGLSSKSSPEIAPGN